MTFRIESPRVLIRNAVRFDTKRNIAITTHCCVLAQNAFQIGPKRILFWPKTRGVLGQNAKTTYPCSSTLGRVAAPTPCSSRTWRGAGGGATSQKMLRRGNIFCLCLPAEHFDCSTCGEGYLFSLFTVRPSLNFMMTIPCCEPFVLVPSSR